MSRGAWAVVATTTALLVLAASAAAKTHKPYFLKSGHYCGANYVRKWVKVRPHKHGKAILRAECFHVDRPTTTFYWCSPYPTSSAPYATTCSTDTSLKGDPRNPFSTTTSRQISLDGYFAGSLQSDVSPQGYLTFTITGPADSSYTASWFDRTQDATVPSCDKVYDDNGQASGACNIVFNTPGTYKVSISFTDTDRSYRNATGPTETVIVS
jgi:hypothetical protein